MGVLGTKAGVRRGRGLGDFQGPQLRMGRRRPREGAAEQEAGFVPAPYSNSYLNFLSSIGSCLYLTLDWEPSIISCMTLDALLDFFGSQFCCL